MALDAIAHLLSTHSSLSEEQLVADSLCNNGKRASSSIDPFAAGQRFSLFLAKLSLEPAFIVLADSLRPSSPPTDYAQVSSAV